MGNIFATMRRAPKRSSAVLAMIAAAVIVPASLLAWGPARETYTIEHPADHVVFNSITNNPSHGDERNFMQVREKSASNATYADEIALTPGKEYVVYMYYHNNAASNYNDANSNYKGIAKDAFVRAEIPAVVPQGSDGTKAVGFVGASNAQPKQVWDDISFTNSSAGAIALRYVPSSATIHSFGAVNGATLPDSIITTGAPLGYDSLNGVVPGCNEYAGYVTFRVKADQPNFTVSKKVRQAGTKEWKENINVQPGDKVDYLVEYENTGTTRQNDVVVKDNLPNDVSYVDGSSKIANPTHPGGVATDDGVTSSQGLNIGNYQANSNAFVMFSAKVAGSDKLECGKNTLVNKATVETNNGSKSDTATIVVNKECQPEPKLSCDALSVSQLSRTKFKFNTEYTVENATFKDVTYVVKNASGEEVYRGTDATYTQEVAGEYSVQAFVKVVVDGKTKTVTSDGCVKHFEVTPPEVEPCPIPGKEDLPKDSPDCKVDECKPGIPVGDERCEDEKCPIPGKENLPKDSEDCAETPAALPETGAGDAISAVIGLGSLITAASYYVASRRALIGR